LLESVPVSLPLFMIVPMEINMGIMVVVTMAITVLQHMTNPMADAMSKGSDVVNAVVQVDDDRRRVDVKIGCVVVRIDGTRMIADGDQRKQ